MGVLPAKIALPTRGSEPESSKLRFCVWVKPRNEIPKEEQALQRWRDESEESQPDLFAGRDSNPGLLAGDIVKLLKRRGPDGTVTIGGMGAVATSKALKALSVSHAYLEDSFGPGEKLAAVPAVENLEVYGEERFRMVLSCCRVQVPSKAGTLTQPAEHKSK